MFYILFDFFVEIGFPASVTPIMEGIIDLHNHIFFYCILVFVLVLWLFGTILFSFCFFLYQKNDTDKLSLILFRRLNHQSFLEFFWTIIPSLILVIIAIPSFTLLYAMESLGSPSLTIKVIGHQWYWSYQYSDCLSDIEYNGVEHPELMLESVWNRVWRNAYFFFRSYLFDDYTINLKEDTSLVLKNAYTKFGTRLIGDCSSGVCKFVTAEELRKIDYEARGAVDYWYNCYEVFKNLNKNVDEVSPIVCFADSYLNILVPRSNNLCYNSHWTIFEDRYNELFYNARIFKLYRYSLDMLECELLDSSLVYFSFFEGFELSEYFGNKIPSGFLYSFLTNRQIDLVLLDYINYEYHFGSVTSNEVLGLFVDHPPYNVLDSTKVVKSFDVFCKLQGYCYDNANKFEGKDFITVRSYNGFFEDFDVSVELFFNTFCTRRTSESLFAPINDVDFDWFFDCWVQKFFIGKLVEGLSVPVKFGKQLPGIQFDSYMLDEAELVRKGDYRLLEVDKPLVVPTNTSIRLLITSDDVLHSFAIPQLGIKIDAVPGRLNQEPLFIKNEGVFYGQCSEICGVNHGFMPIVVKAVSFKEFIHWYFIQFDELYPDYELSLVDASVVYDFFEKGKFPDNFSGLFPKDYFFTQESLSSEKSNSSFDKFFGIDQKIFHRNIALMIDRFNFYRPGLLEVNWGMVCFEYDPFEVLMHNEAKNLLILPSLNFGKDLIFDGGGKDWQLFLAAETLHRLQCIAEGKVSSFSPFGFDYDLYRIWYNCFRSEIPRIDFSNADFYFDIKLCDPLFFLKKGYQPSYWSMLFHEAFRDNYPMVYKVQPVVKLDNLPVKKLGCVSDFLQKTDLLRSNKF